MTILALPIAASLAQRPDRGGAVLGREPGTIERLGQRLGICLFKDADLNPQRRNRRGLPGTTGRWRPEAPRSAGSWSSSTAPPWTWPPARDWPRSPASPGAERTRSSGRSGCCKQARCGGRPPPSADTTTGRTALRPPRGVRALLHHPQATAATATVFTGFQRVLEPAANLLLGFFSGNDPLPLEFNRKSHVRLPMAS
jgi:hypothetical protein